jgi:hypothetical protein
MRSVSVKVAGKDVTVRELKIKELTELVEKIGGDIEGIIGADSADEFKTVILKLLYDKLPIIFPTLTKEDIDEAYPSELEELIGGFVNSNFFGVKKVVGEFLKLAQKR